MNRFDIVEAYYCFYADYHAGMGTPEYARLCKIEGYFRPRPSIRARGAKGLTPAGRAIYCRLVKALWVRNGRPGVQR